MEWQDKSLYDKIVDRWEELDSKYSKINRNRDMIVNYFRCDEILEVGKDGEIIGDDIYNASGMWYAQMMARGFQGTFVPKNIPWLDYQIDLYELHGVDALDEWIQEVTRYMADDYRRSNFYDVQPQFILDSITTGSPVMFGDEDIIDRRVVWTPIHFKNVRVYYDKRNEDEGVIVKDPNWTAKQIFDTFIQRDDDSGTRRNKMLPPMVIRALEAGRHNEEFAVYRAVFKASDPIWKKLKRPNGDWQWFSVYFCEDATPEQKDTPLNQAMGYFTKPYVVNNYDKKPWEAVSRTPAWYAVWDNLGLQDTDRALRENMLLKNRPPRVALNEMENRIDFSSEGMTYVEMDEYDRPPRALDLIGDIQYNEKMVEIGEERQRRWFMADFWRRFNELARSNAAPVSVLQIYQMMGENATQLSPLVESYSKYLNISDALHVSVAQRRGEYPFDIGTMQEVLMTIIQNMRQPFRIPKKLLRPVFVNALTQAQKRSQQLEPLVQGPRMLSESGLTAIDPAVRHIIRPYKTADDILQAIGFPQGNVRPEGEYNELANAERDAIAKQQEFANAIELAKASKPAADAMSTTMGQK